MKRYQLTKPFVGDKVYEASLKKGAKKCYNDVKKEKIPYINSFTIREIDTGKTYTYQIHRNAGVNSHFFEHSTNTMHTNTNSSINTHKRSQNFCKQKQVTSESFNLIEFDRIFSSFQS